MVRRDRLRSAAASPTVIKTGTGGSIFRVIVSPLCAYWRSLSVTEEKEIWGASVTKRSYFVVGGCAS
jgi:hypothetical protein